MLSQGSARELAFKLYENTWRESFLSDEETVKYWETERQTGRLKRSNIEILLHCIAVLKGFFDPDENKLSDLSKVWKDKIRQRNTKQELEEFIDEIVAKIEGLLNEARSNAASRDNRHVESRQPGADLGVMLVDTDPAARNTVGGLQSDSIRKGTNTFVVPFKEVREVAVELIGAWAHRSRIGLSLRFLRQTFCRYVVSPHPAQRWPQVVEGD